MPLLLPLQFSSIEPLFTLETGRLLYKGAEKKKKTWTEKKKKWKHQLVVVGNTMINY